MSLKLYMVGVVVEDMARAIEFYRRLGVDIPEGGEKQPHVEVKMGEMTFFLHTKKLTQVWDKVRVEPSGGYRIILEFYLESREAVDAKYQEMIGYGYSGHFEPYDTPINTYFAMINDPDGNSMWLSAGENA